MISSEATTGNDYALGHQVGELDRLVDQARYFGDFTDEMLRRAGVGDGMHVLDIGCGAGDVSFQAARWVGPCGSVTGVDASKDAVAMATRRAKNAGVTNVRFRVADVQQLETSASYDAIVGRLVLMYFADPAVLLRRLLGALRPGGIVAFQEIDAARVESLPRCELLETCVERIRKTLARVGADPRCGLRLERLIREAGLPVPDTVLHARVERAAEGGTVTQLVQLTRTLLPAMERTGVAMPAEVDIDGLETRLRAEAAACDATLVSPAFVSAWTRKPQ